MSKLLIVESPTKARTISRMLGSDYNVIASMGHVRDLPEHDFGIDIANNFAPQYVDTPRSKQVLKTLRDAGIPTVVWLSPILPFLNDTEENIAGILDYCIRAGVHGIICFGMGVTLREGDREYFYAALDKHFPGLRQKYHKKYEDERKRIFNIKRFRNVRC